MGEIHLLNLSKRWGSFVGVDKFDLTISDREFLVLLGPSGCGKTTLLRLIAGFERPTHGVIAIDGREVASSQRWLTPERRGVGIHIGCRENLRACVRGVPLSTQRKREVSRDSVSVRAGTKPAL